MSKTLKLHIGQHKTGTSYLQSVLALSVEALAAQGIHYGTDNSTKRAAAGAVSFGNWPSFKALLDAPETLRDIAAPTVLFSSEGFCENLPDPDFLARFQNLAQSDAIQRIEVLLYIRDPVDYAVSYFQQLLKRAGHSQLDQGAVFDAEPGPQTVRAVIEALDGVPKVTLRVLNYSLMRADLRQSFADWLGVGPDILADPPVATVNRSMTVSELMLIAAVNRHVAQASGALADALCNALPDVEAEHLRPSIADQNAYWDRIARDVDWVNARIPAAQAYDRKRDLAAPVVVPVAVPGQAVFLAGQIEVIAQVLAQALQDAADLRSKMTELRQRGAAQRARIAELQEALANKRGA